MYPVALMSRTYGVPAGDAERHVLISFALQISWESAPAGVTDELEQWLRVQPCNRSNVILEVRHG